MFFVDGRARPAPDWDGHQALAVVVQSDGKIIAASRENLVRHLPDGAIDARFGGNGVVPLPAVGGWPRLDLLPGDAFLVGLGAGQSGPSQATRATARSTLPSAPAAWSSRRSSSGT